MLLACNFEIGFCFHTPICHNLPRSRSRLRPVGINTINTKSTNNYMRTITGRMHRLEEGDTDGAQEYETSIQTANDDKKMGDKNANTPSSRRQALQLMAATTMGISLASLPQPANAGKPEIDSKSGQLFSPKSQMLGGGGSDMARGIQLQSRSGGERGAFAERSVGLLQPVYNTRFITYLSRFLLNCDPAAQSWWQEQKFSNEGKLSVESQKKLRFAEFAESVEVGLADYFVGPYGSYASVQAGTFDTMISFVCQQDNCWI